MEINIDRLALDPSFLERINMLSREEEEELEGILRANPETTFMEKLQYWVHVQNLTVIPVNLAKKAIRAWKHLQNSKITEREIAEWNSIPPNTGIAVLTGGNNGLTIIDCDTPKALEKIKKLLPPEGRYPIVNTPNGGGHIWGAYTPDLKQSQLDKVKKAWFPPEHRIDIRNDGGYALLPGSCAFLKDENGNDTERIGPYELYENTNRITKTEFLKNRSPFPAELIEYINETIGNKKPDSSASGLVFNADNPIDEPLLPISKGTRDDRLFHLALQLFKSGEPYNSIEQIILTTARGCAPPFDDKDVHSKVDSAYKHYQKGGARNRRNTKETCEVEKLAIKEAYEVQERQISWLWRGVIPTHMATSLTGDQGLGKTLVAVDLAARISRGIKFPIYDRDSPVVVGRTLYISSEGVPDMILVPRLRAAGANLSKIKIIEGTYLKSGESSIFDVTKDLPLLEEEAENWGEVKLVVIDPIASFLPDKINTNQQNQVRRAMDLVSNMAYRQGIAAVIVMHWAKDKTQKAVNRTAGSTQFGAAMKMSWSVVKKDGDPNNVRILVPQKSNITGGKKSIPFVIQGVEYPGPISGEIIETAKIEYGELIDDDPEMLISPPQENENNVAQACKYLEGKLKEGTTLYASSLIAEAKQTGIPSWALYKAKKRMGIEDDKERKFQGRTFWFKRTL